MRFGSSFLTGCGLLATVGTAWSAEPTPQPTSYTPLSVVKQGPVTVSLPIYLRSRMESVTSFPIDRYGEEIEQHFEWLPVARVGAKVEATPDNLPFKLLGEYEHDVTTGTAVGAPDEAGYHLPNGQQLDAELRKGYVRAEVGKYLVFGGGYMLSHWGLGLLANDGAHGWTPGSARFSDPRSGDRVLRGYVGSQPLGDLGVVLRFAYDGKVKDDLTLGHDDATQYILSARFGSEETTTAGIYTVYRQQDSDVRRGFDAIVIDVMAMHTFRFDGGRRLTLAAEGVVITGDTTLAPTQDLPKHDLFQLGGTIEARLDLGGYGGVFSILYASGDQNFDDHDQNAFRIDPNYEFGLLLYRQVQAAQTGRAPITAGDPNLVGRPVPDLDRIPTGGSPTNTIAFFPRGWIQSPLGLEAYGGPLVALSEVNSADAFNTRIEGGSAHNALGANPGRFFGVELDAGIRYRTLFQGTELILGVEGGVLFPGNAFRQMDGDRMDEVLGMRATIDYRL